MAFQLRVARGHQEGRSYLIAQSRLRLGSGEGNDVVLSDAGVSGHHVQIVEREGRYFVSDLSSANGTYVNGEPVKDERELKTGDALAIGAALLSFVQVEGDKKATPLVPVETHDDTRPEPLKRHALATDLNEVPRGAISTDRVKPKVFGDEDATAPVGAPLVDPETTAPEALPLGSLGDLPPVKKELYERPAPSINSLLKAELGVQREEPSHDSLPPLEISRSELAALRAGDEPSDSRGRAKPWESRQPSGPLEPSDPSGLSLSSALSITPVNDRDGEPTHDERPHRHTDTLAPRVHRTGLIATLEDLPGWAKMSAAAVLGLLVVLAGAAIVRLLRGPSEPALATEPTELTSETLDFSFGLSPGVVYEQADQKTFEFEVPASPPSMVLLHYEAFDIDAKEVAILVNNTDLGFVPADSGIAGRQLELLVPPEQLKAGQKNTITFDNLKNPPGRDSWRVMRLSLEVRHLSPLVDQEAVKAAQKKIDEGNALYSEQKAAKDNLLKAWVAYREAYLMLVGNPTGPGKALLPVARAKSDEVGLQLDKECGRLLAAAKKQMDDKEPQQARASLAKIDEEFSSDEHRCRGLAAEKRDEYLLK